MTNTNINFDFRLTVNSKNSQIYFLTIKTKCMFGIKKITKEFRKGINTLSNKTTCIIKEINEIHGKSMEWIISIDHRINDIEKNATELKETNERLYKQLLHLENSVWMLENPPIHRVGDVISRKCEKDGKHKEYTIIGAIFNEDIFNIRWWSYKVLNNKTKEVSYIR